MAGAGSAVAAVTMSVALAACGGGQSGGSSAGTDSLTINVNGSGPFVCNYNPYSPNQTDGSASSSSR